MAVQVRFAPSPTGRLHVGNIYIALHNWLFARKAGGRFMLRLDDTDIARSTQEFADAIAEDLRWLGLSWDDFARQTDRLARYREEAQRLEESGRLYPCYETAEELALKRKIRLGQGLPPLYDRAALALTIEQKKALETEGKRPHWRFKLLPQQVEWTDLVRGPQHIDTTSQSDPVLVREDGTFLYTFTSVVDDADFGVSHVIRGNDHVTNTATQMQIFEALGAVSPIFAHLPLLVDHTGEGLSKRLGALSIGEMREKGVEPMAVNAYLAYAGSGEGAKATLDLQPLIDDHDLSRFGKSSPRFDIDELQQLSVKILHALPYEAAMARLAARGHGSIDPLVWEITRGNIEKIEDSILWHNVCRGTIDPSITDPDFTQLAARHLPMEPWSQETWGIWTKRLAEETGRKGGKLFLPLRLALTANDKGPEMKYILPLIGYEKAKRRLLGERA